MAICWYLGDIYELTNEVQFSWHRGNSTKLHKLRDATEAFFFMIHRLPKLFRRTLSSWCWLSALTGVFLDVWPVAAELISLGPSRASAAAQRRGRIGAEQHARLLFLLVLCCMSVGLVGPLACGCPLFRPVVACPPAMHDGRLTSWLGPLTGFSPPWLSDGDMLCVL